MSKNINYGIVGMKNNKGKSKGFKYLQQEAKRKQKEEEIVKAIQKIQNAPIKKNLQKQFKSKHLKTYANSERNIKEDFECYEQANNDALKELNYDYEDYHEQWSNIQINLSQDTELDEYDFAEDKHSDFEEYEDINETNDDEYACEDSSYDDIDEFLQPIVPKHIELESRIHDLETKLNASQETIFQLIGGLFNQENQKQILDNHIKFLYTGRTLTDEEIEECRWPTTRQGDENERRIQQLEENIDILVKRLKKGKPLHRFYRKFQKNKK